MYHNLSSHPRESWSQTHLLQLSHYQITTQICGSPLGFPLHLSPSLYQHCNHTLRPQSSLGWIAQQAPRYLLVLDLPTIPFILFIATTTFFQMKMWALHSSPCKLPCCPIAFSLKSKLLRMSFKAPQLHSVAPLSSCIFHSLFPYMFRQRIFEQFIVSRFSPVSVLFLKLFPLPKTFSPSYLVSYPLALLTSFHFSKPSQARDESLLWEEMKIAPLSVLWPVTWCSGVGSPKIKS